MKIDFEGFLMEKHAEDYIGTKDCMIDDFARWVQDLEVEDFIKYGDLYAKTYYKSKVPNKKEHLAILSNKDLIFTGKLVEGRTIQDWIKYGYNQAIDDFHKEEKCV